MTRGHTTFSPFFTAWIAAADAGIESLPGGRLYGSSDRVGAYPRDHRITPGELAATIYHVLGVDPASQVTTMLERPWQICNDRPVLDLWG